MKKTLIVFLAIVAIPLSLTAGSYCSKCNKGSRGHRSYGKHQQYSRSYEYNVKMHQDRSDYSVTEDDQRIAGEIRNRIQRGNFDNPNDIQIFVEFGKVILEGKVDNGRSKQAVEQAAFQVVGVRNVVNGLYVDNRKSQQNGTQFAGKTRNSLFN